MRGEELEQAHTESSFCHHADMDFAELASIGAEPSPTHLGSFIVGYLDRHGPARRSDLMRATEAEWRRVANGPMKTALVPRMKKALKMLTEQRTVIPTGAYGIWALSESTHSERLTALNDAEPVELDPTDDDDDSPETSIADRVIGNGAQQVYCFYLAAYRDLATARGESEWPIKIGMTAGQLSSRMDTHRTALPEEPLLTLVIETDYAATLEKVLHGVLTLRGKRTNGTGGTEWFTTTPQEIEAIYHAVIGDAEPGSPPASPLQAGPTRQERSGSSQGGPPSSADSAIRVLLHPADDPPTR